MDSLLFNKRSYIIFSFEKGIVEAEKLERLGELGPYKYKDAIVKGCEKPDIQNFKLSIGVEVTTCDFDEIYRWHKYYGRFLLKIFKMEGIDPIRFSEIEHLCIGEYAKLNMNDLIDEKLYLERKGRLKQLKTYKDIQKLNSHDKLYIGSSLNWFYECDENLRIKKINPSAFFIGQIVNKLRDIVNKKQVKFKNYKKFDENNLYIQTLSADNKEYREFKETTDFSNCCFDYIYISNYSSKYEPIYIIDTRE